MDESTIWWLLAGATVGMELMLGTFYLLMVALGLAGLDRLQSGDPARLSHGDCATVQQVQAVGGGRCAHSRGKPAAALRFRVQRTIRDGRQQALRAR